MGPALVLIDSDCLLCNGFARWIARVDRHNRISIAALSEPLGQQMTARFGITQEGAGTVVLVQRDWAWTRSTAVIRILVLLGWPWKLAGLALLIPRSWRDAVYNLIARHRHRLGAARACTLPPAEIRAKFLP